MNTKNLFRRLSIITIFFSLSLPTFAGEESVVCVPSSWSDTECRFTKRFPNELVHQKSAQKHRIQFSWNGVHLSTRLTYQDHESNFRQAFLSFWHGGLEVKEGLDIKDVFDIKDGVWKSSEDDAESEFILTPLQVHEVMKTALNYNEYYDLLSNNCMHFGLTLANSIGIGDEYSKFILLRPETGIFPKLSFISGLLYFGINSTSLVNTVHSSPVLRHNMITFWDYGVGLVAGIILGSLAMTRPQ